MIGDGDEAPAFTLPAVEGGEFREISLADYLGDDIVVLAFYPADFNPCCDGETTDLDELDLFTMQKDVSIVGISGDSVYSHRAFAERYDLKIPLLADVDGTVAAAYGVAVDGEGYQCNRAVVVIGPDGTVEYAWQTDRLRELPPVDAVRRAVDGIGGAGTAEARYRVGHAHYVEGRRAFTSAMGEFGEREWMMAQGDFTRAREEFDEAADQFDTATRFSEDDEAQTYFERAEEKAGALSQAAEWLAQAASAYASGEGREGENLRSDAERPLETARDIHEPPDPDDFPPEEDPAETGDEEPASILPDEDEPTATLDADIDAPPDATPDAADDADGTETRPASTTASPESEVTPAAESSGETAAADAATEDTADDGDSGGETIDDAELEEITAEVEAQTRKAQAERAAERDGDSEDVVPDDPATPEDETADSEQTAVDEDITGDGTLDLADPTEGEDGEDGEDDEDDSDESGPAKDPDDDLSGDSHGVPDSL